MSTGVKFYEILEIEKTATEIEVKQAYKKMALKYHPDKNPDGAEHFKMVCKAYEILSDPKKREIYDNYGEDGIRARGSSGGFGMHDPMDIFSTFFGTFFGTGGVFRQHQETQAGIIVRPFSVPLETFYTGATKKIKITRQLVCSKCSGVGGEKDGISKCKTCDGHGLTKQNVQIIPGVIQRGLRQCSECKGTGEFIKIVCKSCRGKKRVESEETLEIKIEKGMPDEEQFLFENKGDQEVGLKPGHIVIVLDQKEHPTFVREGNDLHAVQKLNLTEALCGCRKPIKTLDDRIIVYSVLPGEVIKHGDKKVIRGEGMPIQNRPSAHGDLILHFEVEFPDQMATHDIKQLRELLPGKPEVFIPEKATVYEMEPSNPNASNSSNGQQFFFSSA